MALGIFSDDCVCTSLYKTIFGTCILRKFECFRHALVVNTSAWNDKTGLVVGDEILRFVEDDLLRKHLSTMFSLIKNESLGIEDDQIPS